MSTVFQALAFTLTFVILAITSLFVEDPPCLGWGGGIIEDATYLMNFTDKILLALKVQLIKKYSASMKSQHSLINKKVRFESHCHFFMLDTGVAMQYFVVWLVLAFLNKVVLAKSKVIKYNQSHPNGNQKHPELIKTQRKCQV